MPPILTPAESRALGWDDVQELSEYPSEKEVAAAPRQQLCYWYRYLRSPHSGCEADILDTIIEKLKATYPDV